MSDEEMDAWFAGFSSRSKEKEENRKKRKPRRKKSEMEKFLAKENRKLESKIQNKIIKRLNKLDLPGLNIRVWRTNSGRVQTYQGHWFYGSPAFTPDVTGWINGLFIGVEVKRPGEKPTEGQYERLALINSVGGIGIWATSPDEAVLKIQIEYQARHSRTLPNVDWDAK